MKEARLHQEISKYSDQGVRKHWLIVPCEKRFSLANACKPGPTLVGRPCCRPRRVEPHLWGEGILCIKSRSKISIQLNWEFQNLSLKKQLVYEEEEQSLSRMVSDVPSLITTLALAQGALSVSKGELVLSSWDRRWLTWELEIPIGALYESSGREDLFC